MINLDEAQQRTFREALAEASSLDEAERLAFAIWTESKGYVYANDGRNTSRSPGVTPAVREILIRSMSLPHDKVGSNGRSTGPLQQLSREVGGSWGDMAGTMSPAISARRFLTVLKVSGLSLYSGNLVQPDGSTRRVTVQLSSPVAADVLRVQQPLADEAESSNYNASQVAIAKAIAAQFFGKKPTVTAPSDSSFIARLLHWS
jgi:hypothetical protein